MLTIKRTQVPNYLRASACYKFLNEEDDEEILISPRNLKKSPNVSDSAELIHLLSTARFWGLDNLPEDALNYAMYSVGEDVFNQMEEYEDAIQTVACLKAIRLAEGEQKVLRAAEFGRIDFLRFLMKAGNVLQPSAGVQAAANNHLACLEFITKIFLEDSDKYPYKLVHLQELPNSINYICGKHLHEHGGVANWYSVNEAAQAGNLAYLQYLHEQNARVTKKSMERAAANAHLPCVAFIHEQGNIACDVEHAYLAAAGGHLDCLKYLFEHGCPPHERISTAAANGGHIECLKYAHEQGCSINKTTMTRTRCLDCVKYLREHGVDLHDCVIYYAMQEDRLDFLQYFHEQGALISLRHLGAACTTTGVSLRFLYEHGVEANTEMVQKVMIPRDALQCLKIVMEFGYKPTAEDCAVAAENGAIECLKYLHSCQCPWDESLCTRAARNAQLVTLEFALQHGCPATADACQAAAGSPREESLECLQALHEAGGPWDERTTAAAATAYQGAAKLKFAHENGCPWDKRTCTAAARAGNLSCLQYAREQSCPWDHEIFQIALELRSSLGCLSAKARIDSVLRYLRTRGCPRIEKANSGLQAHKWYKDVRRDERSHQLGVATGGASVAGGDQGRNCGPAWKKRRTASFST